MKLRVALAAWLVAAGAWAQVQTQGWITADETWTGKVDVVGDVMVTNGATLTIAAGAEVAFMSNGLAVYIPGTDSSGRILLLGEATNRIRVTSVPGLATNGTMGRYPNQYARELRAEYVDFSNLGYARADGRGYSVYNGPNDGDSFIVRSCTFSNCYDAAGIAFHTNALVEITGNDFRYSATNLSARIDGSIILQVSNRVVAGNTADAGINMASSGLVYSNVLAGSNAFLAVGAGAHGSVVERNYVYVPRNAGSAISVAATNVAVRDNYMLGARECLAVSGVQGCEVSGNVMQAATNQTRHISGLAGHSVVSGNILFGAQPANEMILLAAVLTNLTIRNNVLAGSAALAFNITTGAVSEVRVRNNIFYFCGANNRPVLTYVAGLTNVLAEADYNCFYSTNTTPTNYSGRVTVAGKTVRVDAGFGYNDLTAGGPVNEQVDPLLAGPVTGLAVATPEQMLARAHTIDEVLAEARAAFALQAGSPCIDAGDPADGAGTDIGLEFAAGGDPDDLDADGMADAWELEHFGSLTNDWSGDVDADGMPNREEFIALTQPTNAGSRFVVMAFTNSAARHVVVPSVTGRLYRLWATPVLAPTQLWTEVAGPLAGTGGTISLNAGSTTNFEAYRLTVELETP